MGNIRQERPNEGLILNVNKQKIWLPLNKTFGTHVEKYVVFKVFRNRRCIIPRNKVFSGVKNIILPKRSRSHNAKTGKHIHKIFGILERFPVCQLKSGGVLGRRQVLNSTKILSVNTRNEA